MSHVYLRSDCTDGTERRSQTSALFSACRCFSIATDACFGRSLAPLIRQPPSRIHGPGGNAERRRPREYPRARSAALKLAVPRQDGL